MHLHWQPEFTCRHVSYSSEYRMSMLREQPSGSQVYSRIQCSALQYSCQCNSDDYHTQDAWIYAVMTHEHRASAAQGHTNVSGSRQTRSCRETCAAKNMDHSANAPTCSECLDGVVLHGSIVCCSQDSSCVQIG